MKNGYSSEEKEKMPGLIEGMNNSVSESSVSLMVNVQFEFSKNVTKETSNIVQLSADLHREFLDAEAEDDDAGNYLSIKLLGSSLFGLFKIYKVSSSPNESLLPSTILFINHVDLIQYEENLTIEKALVCNVKPINLESVFISCPPEIYRVMKQLESHQLNRFITSFIQDRPIAMNDKIREINSTIILSEPVNNGLIYPDTRITVIKDEKWSDIVYSPNSLDEGDKIIDMSDLLVNNSIFDPVISSNLIKLRTETLTGKTEEIELEDYDGNNVVFLNSDDLAKVGVFSGDMIQLTYTNDSSLESSRFLRVYSFLEPNSFACGTVYLSPVLLYNLGLPKEVKVSKTRPVKDFKVAQQATISRIASPITLEKKYQDVLFNELRTYFSPKLRIIKQGDVIPIGIDSVLSKILADSFPDGKFPSVVPQGTVDSIAWFKVTSLDNSVDQFIIDPSKTNLIQSGFESERLPPNNLLGWYDFLDLPRMFNYSQGSSEKKFSYFNKIKRIVESSIDSKINLETTILLNSSTRGSGKASVMKSVSIETGINLVEIDCYEVLNPSSETKTIGTIRGKFDRAVSTMSSSGVIVCFKHVEGLAPKQDPNQNNKSSISAKLIEVIEEYLSYGKVIIAMTCNDTDKLDETLRSLVKFEIEVGVPNESERVEIFKFLLQNKASVNLENLSLENVGFSTRSDVSYQSLALQSAGLSPRDFIAIVENASKFAKQRIVALAKSAQISERNAILLTGGAIDLTPEDFEKSINDARSKFSDSVGAPRIPNVKWEDIGGLDVVKDEILDTIDMPMKHPELFNNGVKKRSGILFYGPPGTGKTLLAKAIATNFSLNFFSVKGPELLNMYIGESEANVRRVFQRARDAKPCVIFFDELDSVAPKRGNQGDSGGVMDRIVSQLLAELDGMSGSDGGDGVFVVGATNRPDLLDEALLRPGRFDKLLYLGISDTHDKQAKVLEALTRKFKLDPSVNLEKVAEHCAFNFTGADFYALCSDAMLNAMTRTANMVDDRIAEYNNKLAVGEEERSVRWWFDNVARADDISVLVNEEDFVKAKNELVPSVSIEELNHYLRVRENFEGGKKKENGAVPDEETIDGVINGMA